MVCTATRICAVWAMAIVALSCLPSLDGFSPSAASAFSRSSTSQALLPDTTRRSPMGRTSNHPTIPFISSSISGKYTPFSLQLRASREELESMTVKVLKQTVSDLGLQPKGLSKMRKAELVDFLLQAETGEGEAEEELEVEEEEDVAEPEPVVAADEAPIDEEPEPEPEPVPEPIQAVEPVAAKEEQTSSTEDSSSGNFKEEVQSPGVETLREFLTYSDYGIKKLQDQRRRGEAIRADIEDGTRDMPAYYYEDFVEEEKDRVEDPNVIIVDEWGTWDERDLAGPPMAGDWDPVKDPNPNDLDPEFEYVTEIPKNEEGVEEGYDPMFGSWYPVDERTVINPSESYIVDEKTRNATSVPKEFPDENDPENAFNADVKTFRKSLKIVETYIDEWTGLEHPRSVATWHGNPPLEKYPDKDFMNNRFTEPGTKTDFSNLTPYQARKKAVELARSKNNEWLPKGKSAAFHDSKTQIYLDKGVLAGSFLEGDKDPEIVAQIQPALDVLGASADLLSIQDTVFRFNYHGLIKNKRGMAAWTETLIRDCGVSCTGVVFESGTRKRDPKYDNSGETWHGPY